jgi:hypothetical protein
MSAPSVATPPEGKVLVSFGHCRRKVIEEEKLQVFVPWWSDCD